MRYTFPLAVALLALTLCPTLSSAQALSEPKAFLFYALWDQGTNDIALNTVQRIERSYTQYEDDKDNFIKAYVNQVQLIDPNSGQQIQQPPPAEGEDGNKGQIQLSLDPNVPQDSAPVVLEFSIEDARNALQNNAPPGAVNSLAEWTFYYWQLRCWEHYIIDDTLMFGNELTLPTVDKMIGTIYKKRQPIWTWSDFNEEEERLPRNWVQDSRGFRALTPPTPEEVAAIEAMRAKSTASYGNLVLVDQQPLNAEMERLGAYRMFQEMAYAVNADEHDRFYGFINRLRERQEARNLHDDWLEFQRNRTIDLAKDWSRKHDGTELNIDGVQYLVSTEPMVNIPRNALNILKDSPDSVVIPHDLIAEDGTLKPPIPIED